MSLKRLHFREGGMQIEYRSKEITRGGKQNNQEASRLLRNSQFSSVQGIIKQEKGLYCSYDDLLLCLLLHTSRHDILF